MRELNLNQVKFLEHLQSLPLGERVNEMIAHCLQIRHKNLQLHLAPLPHCDQMVGGQCRVPNRHLPLNLDLRRAPRQVHDQLGHIQVNVKVGCVENLSPTELLLVSLRLGGEVQMSE